MPDWLKVLLKLAFTTLLPTLLYFSTRGLLLNQQSALVSLNNFLWITNAVYFVYYLPVRGLRLSNWVNKVLVALLAIAILTTAFQGAVKLRRMQETGQAGIVAP